MLSPEPIFSGPASADYSATIARFVTIANTGKVILSGNTAFAAGVMYNAPALDEQARINAIGLHRIEAGAGGLAVGDKVMSDANGKGIVAAGAGAFFHGICTKAGAAGEVAQFFWAPGSVAG